MPSPLSNDPAEVLLEINSELLRINQEFHARNLAETMPSELTMYTTRFQSNVTWMIQHTQEFQKMTIPGSRVPLPMLTPPPSVEFTSTERLQALYAHLPSLFSKHLDREQRKRQIQDALSPPRNVSSTSTPLSAASPSIRMDHDSASASPLTLNSTRDTSTSVEVNDNGKRPRVEDEEETLDGAASTSRASFSPPTTFTATTASTPANRNGHHKRISIGGGSGTRRRHTSISSPSSSSTPTHSIVGSSSSSPERENEVFMQTQTGGHGDKDAASPVHAMNGHGSGSAAGLMGPPPVPARVREGGGTQSAGGSQQHRQRPLNQPSPVQSTTPTQSNHSTPPTTPTSTSGHSQAPTTASTRSKPTISRDVFGPLPLSVRERPRPPKELLPALLAMVQDSTPSGSSPFLNGTGYAVGQPKGNFSVYTLRSQVKEFDSLPPGKKIELLWAFQRNQVALYKKQLASREMEREIYGEEAAKSLGGSSLLAHGRVFIADGSDTGRVYVNGVLQPQTQTQPPRASTSMAPPPVPSNPRHATRPSSTSSTARVGGGEQSGAGASPAPSTSSSDSNANSRLAFAGTPTAVGTPTTATSPPSTLDAATTPSASTPTSSSTPLSNYSTSTSTPSASASTPLSIPSPSWDWSALFDSTTTRSNPSAPPSTLESRLDDSGVDPYALLLAASVSSAPSPASTSGGSERLSGVGMPTPERIQLNVRRGGGEQQQQNMGVSPVYTAPSPTLVGALSPAASFGAMSPFAGPLGGGAGGGGMSPTSFMGLPSADFGGMMGPSPSDTLVGSPAELLGAGSSPWNPTLSDPGTVYIDGNFPTTNYLW